MKKLLATLLAVVMVLSAGAACLFTSSAANETTKALKTTSWYNEVKTKENLGNSYDIEFDLWLLTDDSYIAFWADGSYTRYTIAKTYVGVVVEGAGGYGSAAGQNDTVAYDWGETGPTTDNHHHVKIELNKNGSDNIWIDGEEKYHSNKTANEYWNETTVIFNTDNEKDAPVMIDNFKIAEEELVDFENGNKGILDGCGDIVEAFTKIEKAGEMTKGLMLTQYGNIKLEDGKGDLGSSYDIEFDLWLLGDDSTIEFWADVAYTRYTIGKTQIGVDASGSSGYGSSDMRSFEWGETGPLSANHHHVKIELNREGSDNIWIDGEEKYHSDRTATQYYTGTEVSFMATGSGVVVDNFKLGNRDTIDFENGVDYFKGDGIPENIIDVYLTAGGETVTSKALKLDTGYGYFTFPNPLCGKSDGDDTGYGNYTVEFDLWFLGDDSAIKIWADFASTRYTLSTTQIGVENSGSGSYGSSDLRSFDKWGETGVTTDNHHHVKFELGVNGSDNIYVDGEQVYTSGRTANGYWAQDFIMITEGAGVIIDNLEATNNDKIDFENGEEGIFSGVDKAEIVDAIISAGGEVACPHILTEERVNREPTCKEEGEMGTWCQTCGEELVELRKPIDKVDHKWAGQYDPSYRQSETDDTRGYNQWNCQFDCGTSVRNSIPAKNEYVGTFSKYYDFSSEDVTVNILQTFVSMSEYGFEFKSDDTGSSYMSIPEGNSSNYLQLQEEYNDGTDYSISVDVRFNGTYETNDTASHGHAFYFQFGGASGFAYSAGYDADKNVLFIKDGDGVGGNDVDHEATPYSIDLEDKEWHTLTLRFRVDDQDTMDASEHTEDGYYYVALELDGVEILTVGKWYEDGELWGDTFEFGDMAPAAGDVKKFAIMKNFGIQADIDNLVQGDSEFKWTRLIPEEVLVGDVNGDGKVNVVDLRVLKANYAGVEGIVINEAAADVDGDGTPNVQDVIALAKLLAK